MIRIAGLLPLALLACGERQPSAAPAPVASRVAAPALTASATPRRQIGSVSGLSGTASGLRGTVSGFQVLRTETATVATLAADTLFAFDSATLAGGANDNLARTAALIRDGGSGPVKVVGHTDAKGSDAYNDALSERRARAVAEWLAGPGGLSSRTFAVEGRGKREPVAENARPDGSDDPDGRARNRRVEVIVPR